MEYAPQKEIGWMSIKRIMPQDGKRVLVCYENGEVSIGIALARSIGRLIVHDQESGVVRTYAATYWMPLPALPKEVQP